MDRCTRTHVRLLPTKLSSRDSLLITKFVRVQTQTMDSYIVWIKDSYNVWILHSYNVWFFDSYNVWILDSYNVWILVMYPWTLVLLTELSSRDSLLITKLVSYGLIGPMSVYPYTFLYHHVIHVNHQTRVTRTHRTYESHGLIGPIGGMSPFVEHIVISHVIHCVIHFVRGMST